MFLLCFPCRLNLPFSMLLPAFLVTRFLSFCPLPFSPSSYLPQMIPFTYLCLNCGKMPPTKILDHFQVYSSVALSTFTFLTNTIVHLQNFFIFPEWNSVPIKYFPILPPCSPWQPPFCCLYGFDYSRELIWVDSYSICLFCDFLCHSVLKVYPCCSVCQNFLPC